MSNVNLKIIAPIAIVGAALGYFGLSSYADGQAEKNLEDYLYENRLESYVSWQSVSSSLFGDTVTIKDLIVESREFVPVELSIERLIIKNFKVIIKNFKDDRDQISVDLSLKKVQPIDPDSDFAKAYNNETFGSLLFASGQTEVEPYDLSVSWDYRPSERALNVQIEADLPNLFATQVKLDLDGVRDLKSALFLTQIHPALDVLPGVSKELLGMNNSAAYKLDAKNITLNGLNISFKDQGYLQRANLLEQRYNVMPIQSTENTQKGRKAAFENQYKESYAECAKEFDSVYKNSKKACKAIMGTWYSQEKGFKVAINPSSKVRLEDFKRLLGPKSEQGRFIEQLNLDVTNY